LQAYGSRGPLSSLEDEPPTLAAILPFPQNVVEQPRAKRPRAKRSEKFTIAEAFSFNAEPTGTGSNDFHLERAIRSVTYLLEFCTDTGNYPLNGFAAYGLSQILKYCADWSRP